PTPEAARELLEAVRRTTGLKGRPLFLPLRLALTGRDHGPDLATLLALLGRDECLGRLAAARRSLAAG
ncbi:MAG: glutamate--tRNA ligase, partial [Nitrospirae bacterium]